MRKLKTEKGITLIALIITIIVMLILVGVTVSVALNGGLFSTAKEAAQKTETAKQEELVAGTAITEYYLAKANGETTAESLQEYVLEKNGLEIGAKVNYDETKGGSVTVPTSDMEWRVLGVNDKGEIELISTKPTEETVELNDKNDYINGSNMLNEACEIYGQGEKTSSTRSLKAEDIYILANEEIPTGVETYTFKYYEPLETETTLPGATIYYIKSSKLPEPDMSKWNEIYAWGVSTEWHTPDWSISGGDTQAREYTTADCSAIQDQLLSTGKFPGELFTTKPVNCDITWAEFLGAGENNLVSDTKQWLNSKFTYTPSFWAYGFISLQYSTDENNGVLQDTSFFTAPGFVFDCSGTNEFCYPSTTQRHVRPVVALTTDCSFTYDSTNEIFNIN